MPRRHADQHPTRGCASLPGKTITLTFDRDSCQEIDIEPGSIGAVCEDQSGQSDDGGFTIEQ